MRGHPPPLSSSTPVLRSRMAAPAARRRQGFHPCLRRRRKLPPSQPRGPMGQPRGAAAAAEPPDGAQAATALLSVRLHAMCTSCVADLARALERSSSLTSALRAPLLSGCCAPCCAAAAAAAWAAWFPARLTRRLRLTSPSRPPRASTSCAFCACLRLTTRQRPLRWCLRTGAWRRSWRRCCCRLTLHRTLALNFWRQRVHTRAKRAPVSAEAAARL